MKKLFKTLFAVFLVLALASCASFTKPRDTRDNLAYAWAGYTATVKTLTVFVRNGALSKAQVRKIQPDLQDARDALNTANLLLDAGQVTDAQNNIDMANKILILLKRLIEAEKAKNAQLILPNAVLKLVPV